MLSLSLHNKLSCTNAWRRLAMRQTGLTVRAVEQACKLEETPRRTVLAGFAAGAGASHISHSVFHCLIINMMQINTKQIICSDITMCLHSVFLWGQA